MKTYQYEGKTIWQGCTLTNTHLWIEGSDRLVCGVVAATKQVSGLPRICNWSFNAEWQPGDSVSCFRCKKWRDKNKDNFTIKL